MVTKYRCPNSTIIDVHHESIITLHEFMVEYENFWKILYLIISENIVNISKCRGTSFTLPKNRKTNSVNNIKKTHILILTNVKF